MVFLFVVTDGAIISVVIGYSTKNISSNRNLPDLADGSTVLLPQYFFAVGCYGY